MFEIRIHISSARYMEETVFRREEENARPGREIQSVAFGTGRSPQENRWSDGGFESKTSSNGENGFETIKTGAFI